MKKFFKSVVNLSVVSIIAFTGCKPKPSYQSVLHDPNLYSETVHELNYVIIYDIFTPPVAARIFAYSNLAAYETLAKEGHHYTTLAGKLNEFKGVPAPAKPDQIDFPFASLIAMTDVV